MREKKLCVVVTCFSQGQPGFLDFSYRIRSLAANYDLVVVSQRRLTQIELSFPDVHYVVIEEAATRLGWLRYIWRCATLIRARSPAVAVLLHSLTAPIALMVGKVPSVVYWNEHPTHAAPDERGVSFLKACLRRAVRGLLFRGARGAELTMPIGEAHRDDLLAQGCRPARTRMIYMGVDKAFDVAQECTPGRGDGGPLRLIYVGSVQHDRGRDVMLEAMAMLARGPKMAHLTIVGASEDQLAYCTHYVEQAGISDSVTVRGRVPGGEIPRFFADSDAGICIWEDRPWYRFNPPTKLFEYLVAGLPVLASDIRTHTEYIKDGVNGVIFDYDSAGLAAAIQRLWLMRDRLPQLKAAARQSSHPYRWENIEPEFLAAVEGVARGAAA
ncbi:MAG TPA: glycosyltransferase family 4 protein [Burkholderiaceae bacterium]